jgi:diacylglycerol kinase family enzyme
MRALLIVNTAASSVTPRVKVVIQKALAADCDLTVAETSRRGHAERLARGAARDGTDGVVVMGGDGTLTEAANGLVGSATALAPLPGGSTNVYARTLGLSRDPVEATGQLLGALARRSMRRIGVGSVNGRRFLFHTGVGFDAAVVEQVERRTELKRWAGHPFFVAASLDTWFRHYDRHGPGFTVEGGSERIDGCLFAIVSKTSPYTYLGSRPLLVAPDAGIESALCLTAFRSVGAVAILSALGVALASGRLLRRHPRVEMRSDLASLVITGPAPFPYQVDGDHLGEVDRLEFTWEPDALTVVVPGNGRG